PGLCACPDRTGAFIPQACDVNIFLRSVATEVDNVTDSLLRELQRQTEAVCAGPAALPHALNTPSKPPKNNDRLLLLPAWLRREGKKESTEERINKAA